MQFLNFLRQSTRFLLSIKLAALIVPTIAIYYQDFIILGNEVLQNEFMSYIVIVPFIFGYLLYRKRKMLQAAISFQTSNLTERTLISNYELVGVLLCLLAFSLYWYGFYTFYPLEFHIFSLPIFLSGAILILFNMQTLRVLAFPIAFLFFLTPPPIEWIYTTSTILASIASQVTFTLLSLAGLPIELIEQYGAPAIILQKPGSDSIPFVIDMACSGIYSLVGFALFAVLIAYIVRARKWQKIVIFIVGFPLIYSLNIIRILIIVMLGYQFGIKIATQIFHLIGGWFLIFLGTFLLLLISDKVFKIQFFQRKTRDIQCTQCDESVQMKSTFCVNCGRLLKYPTLEMSKKDLIKVGVLLLSAIMIVNLQVPVFASSDKQVELSISSLTDEHGATVIFPEISGYEIEFVYRDTSFEEIARREAALVYAYVPLNGSGTIIWATVEIATSRSILHGPEVCLIDWPEHHGLPVKVTQLDLRDVQLLQNPPVFGRLFAFQRTATGDVQVFLYWYMTAWFRTESSLEQKHMKISLIEFVDSAENVSVMEEELLSIGQSSIAMWAPAKTWLSFLLLVVRYSYLIVVALIVLLVLFLMFLALKYRERKQRNLVLFNKISSSEEKFVLQAVYQAEESGKSTLNAIQQSYNLLTKKTVDVKTFIETLERAKEAGLVDYTIINENDEPLITWRTQIAFLSSKPLIQKIRGIFR